jgi:hypothetical protein
MLSEVYFYAYILKRSTHVSTIQRAEAAFDYKFGTLKGIANELSLAYRNLLYAVT